MDWRSELKAIRHEPAGAVLVAVDVLGILLVVWLLILA